MDSAHKTTKTSKVKSANSPNGKPHKRSKKASCLKFTIDGIERRATVDEVRDRTTADTLAETVRSAQTPVQVEITSDILTLSGPDRLAIVDFVCALKNSRFLDSNGANSDLLRAMLTHVRFDPNDVERTARGRRLALETLVLGYPSELKTAAQIVRAHLAESGFKDEKIPQLLKEATEIQKQLLKNVQNAAPVYNLKEQFPDAPMTSDLIVPKGYVLR